MVMRSPASTSCTARCVNYLSERFVLWRLYDLEKPVLSRLEPDSLVTEPQFITASLRGFGLHYVPRLYPATNLLVCHLSQITATWPQSAAGSVKERTNTAIILCTLSKFIFPCRCFKITFFFLNLIYEFEEECFPGNADRQRWLILQKDDT